MSVILMANCMVAALSLAGVLVPDGTNDMTRAVQVRAKSGETLELSEGEYHFYADRARRMEVYVSNHDQPVPRKVQLPLCGVENFTLRGLGKGARLVFHGESTGILLMDAQAVRLENLALDWAEPPIGEARYEGMAKGGKPKLAWRVRGYDGETANAWMLWDGETRSVKPDTGDDFEWSQATAGDIISMRAWSRPSPAICLYRAQDVKLDRVTVHSAHGMGLLAQRSGDIEWSGGGVYPREGCFCSTKADATHFSNCRGKILVKGARFEGMMDDAINVHSTCLRIEETQEGKRIKCRYMHPQAIGFEVFGPGEKLRFIRSRTLENGPETTVREVERLDERTVVLTLADEVPAGLGVGDAVENADYQPEVEFTGNTVKNNRARAALFTTPGKVTVRDNTFDHVSGSAILLAGDASNWFESGACTEVEITGNRFLDCLTSRYQFCNAVITSAPSVPDLAGQQTPYHGHIVVTGNVFDCPGAKLWDGISVSKLEWHDNREGER